MQLSHIHLPSFTLVLTSGHSSFSTPDNLMVLVLNLDINWLVTDVFLFQKTIDLRYVPDNYTYFEDFEFVSTPHMMKRHRLSFTLRLDYRQY